MWNKFRGNSLWYYCYSYYSSYPYSYSCSLDILIIVSFASLKSLTKFVEKRWIILRNLFEIEGICLNQCCLIPEYSYGIWRISNLSSVSNIIFTILCCIGCIMCSNLFAFISCRVWWLPWWTITVLLPSDILGVEAMVFQKSKGRVYAITGTNQKATYSWWICKEMRSASKSVFSRCTTSILARKSVQYITRYAIRTQNSTLFGHIWGLQLNFQLSSRILSHQGTVVTTDKKEWIPIVSICSLNEQFTLLHNKDVGPNVLQAIDRTLLEKSDSVTCSKDDVWHHSSKLIWDLVEILPFCESKFCFSMQTNIVVSSLLPLFYQYFDFGIKKRIWSQDMPILAQVNSGIEFS